MGRPATKRTSKICAACVSRISQKQDPAISAPGQTSFQLRSCPDKGPQGEVILGNKRPDFALPIPAGDKAKKRLNLY